MIEPVSVPPAYTFAWTVVEALRDLNGSGTLEEINERCVTIRGLTEEQQSTPGPQRGTTAVTTGSRGRGLWRRRLD